MIYLINKLTTNQLTITQAQETLVAWGYRETERRPIGGHGFRVRLEAPDDAVISLLTRDDRLKSIDIIFMEIKEPSTFGSLTHDMECEFASQLFNAAILDLSDTIGQPAALRVARGNLVHECDFDEACQFAAWNLAETKLTIANMQWDASSPIVVMATIEHVEHLRQT